MNPIWVCAACCGYLHGGVHGAVLWLAIASGATVFVRIAFPGANPNKAGK